MENIDWRYERKFRVALLNRNALEAWLFQHPAGFRRAYPNRTINNIYYDTPDMRCYAENMAGINERRKFRVRWYGEQRQEIDVSNLEVKIKHNELGRKHHERLGPFNIAMMPMIHQLSSYVYNTGLSFFPSLINRYERSYFISADGKYRLTVDDRMEFQSPDQAKVQSPTWNALDDVVLELKYSQDADDEVSFLTRHIPFRQTKNSKYATGLMLIN